MNNSKRDEDLFELVKKMQCSLFRPAIPHIFKKEASIRKEINTMELTDQEIQSLIDARKVLTKLKDTTTGSREAITFLDIILNDIYEGWISHLDRGC